MWMHTVLINHAHTYTHTHTHKIKIKIKNKIKILKMQNIAELYKKSHEKPTSSSSFTSNICQKSTISWKILSAIASMHRSRRLQRLLTTRRIDNRCQLPVLIINCLSRRLIGFRIWDGDADVRSWRWLFFIQRLFHSNILAWSAARGALRLLLLPPLYRSLFSTASVCSSAGLRKKSLNRFSQNSAFQKGRGRNH